MCLLLLPLLLSWPMFANSAVTDKAGDGTVKAEPLAVQRSEIDQAANLSEEQKKQALSKLDETRTLLEEARQLEARSLELQNQIRQAPERLAKLREDASIAGLRLNLREIEPWTNAQLEVVLNERQLKLTEMQNALEEKDKDLAALLTLARTGGSELATLETRLADLLATVSARSTSAGTDTLAAVDRHWYAAREQVLKARIAWLKTQQGNLSLLTELAQLDRDLSAARIEALKVHVSQLREYVQQRRQADAEAAQQTAQEALSGAPQAIKTLQRNISELISEQARLITKEAEFDRQNEQLTRLNDEVKRDQERIHQIVELGGATAQVSALLQKRRTFAPSPNALTQQVISFQQQLSDAALRQLGLDELLTDTRDIDDQVNRLLAGLPADTSESERDALRQSAREAWSRHREAALDLWKAYTRYIGKLSGLEANTRQLLQTANAYRVFIDDRLLWMPSTELIPFNEPGLLLGGVHWFVKPEHLGQLARDSILALTQQGPMVAVWLVGLIVLLNLRKRARHSLIEAAAATQKVRSDSFKATLTSLGSTLILVLPLPWLLIGAGLLLGNLRPGHEYTLIIAAGLQGGGHTLMFFDTLRQLCRDKGLARAHLLWHPVLCDHLGKQAKWLIPLATPLAFLSSAGAAAVPSEFIRLSTVVQSDEPGLLSLGRLAIIVVMVLLAIAVYRIWSKNGPVIQAMAGTPDRAKWANYHILWFGPSILIPLGLAIAGLTGFYYTTAFLSAKAGETLWFLIVLMFFKDLLLRGLYVTQRRLRFEESVRYREEASAQRAATGDAGVATEAESLPLDDAKVNYGQLGDQVRRLVNLGYTVSLLAGLWWIWSDVIPAFSFLDQVELPITTSRLVDGISRDVPLTLSDMVAGLLLGGLALFAAKNIPALLELTLLQRLPMSRASRYAFTTLTQYIVAMVGLVITFKALGLQWSSIQWLVAALSVGLGFGLQEIVANFISGIILLFEQPIRVGDVVTVDDTTGTVSRIRIRATTIVNWERQELIIPNKSFITGRLINWTLSDTVNRLLITVGVAYDSDTEKAMALMSQVAAEHPKVLTDPPPRISFEGFGDNALTLVMRAFLNEVDARLATITELHQSILLKFRAAGIEIAFPQRDLHLDTSRPLELVLRRDAQGQTGQT